MQENTGNRLVKELSEIQKRWTSFTVVNKPYYKGTVPAAVKQARRKKAKAAKAARKASR